MPAINPVSSALNALGAPHRVFYHAGIIESIEQAASERNQRPEQVVRSILFRLGEGKYAMVLMAGKRQVSWPKLRHHWAQSRLTMATPQEVLSVTGYVVGTVAPFGLPHSLPILLDQSVLAEEEISFGSGEKGVGIIMNCADFIKALQQVTSDGLDIVDLGAQEAV